MGDLTLGSLFDGSGGFPFGGLIAGIIPIWASEIEPFPIRVTTKRMPFMKHYGDVSRLDGGKIEPVDIITFGSPCQDMSVAGKRGGLDGSRSGLFYEAVRIIKEMRCATDGQYPRYAVWENVPGAFSSNGGEDFRAVLETLCSVKDENISVPRPERWPGAGEIVADGFSIAWRVLDAQYWGVPQRRKRIYLVADFAGGGAGKVLFESEGLSGYSAEGFRSWQRSAGSAAAGSGTAGCCLNDQGGQRMDVTGNVTGTLRAEAHHPPCVMESAGFCTEHSSKSRSIGYEEEVSPTLRAGTVPAALSVFENHSQDTRYTGPLDRAPTVMSTYGTGGNNQPFVVDQAETYSFTTGSFLQTDKDRSPTLLARDYKDPAAVAYGIGRDAFNQGQNAKYAPSIEEEVQPTLVAKGPGAVKNGYTVRRLTPTECARLQGFPDWWCADLGTEKPTDEELYFWYKVFEEYRRLTNPEARPKSSKQIRKWLRDPHSDSAEYKMWGNGVALPCVVFVLSGIVYCSQLPGA